MHVWSLPLTSAQPLPSDPNPNWNWVLQIGLTVILIGLGFLHLLRSTTSKYLLSHPNYSSSSSSSSSSMAVPDSCAVCGKPTSKQCAACKSVKYCSQTCQVEHWKSEHKRTCKELKSSGRVKTQLSPAYGKHKSSVALVPSSGPDRTQKLVDKVLFPYDEFVKLFNWDKQIFPPCGLLNCGNSCFANVVLQCLAHTRPLIAYLLDKGHRRDCRRNEWCFFCELQMHMERASRGQQPFSPINILSRLPTIGGNLGNGKQEDAHEFMRFAIDKMQSVCLDEHGGEKVIHPKAQETTLIQHIFGGQLQSQVVCTQCNQVSRQYENMMDLTVEIQGDATSLEECLDQFTMKEWLHGDNLYKCDGCNDYVRAWKRLTIHQAPNILTIALKRFQSGRFGKINKRITFPETLDLSPYMSEGRDGTDIYKLYAVVVHVDMLNASFFGHYICYTKGFQGDWYRIDDCKVMRVELDEVLSQGAYMLMYSRVSARPTCLKTFESATKHKQEEKVDSASSDGSIEDYGVVNPASGLPASLDTLENRIDTSKAETLNPHHARVSLNFPRSGEQSTSEVSDSFGSSALGVNVACDTSDNASGVDSMSLEVTDAFITVNGVQASAGELVGAGHRSEDGPTVCGNGNDGNIAGVKGGRKAAAFEETTSCEDTCIGDDITGVREDADDMELEDAEVNERCNGAADGMIMNRKVVSSCLDPDEKFSQV